MGNGKSNGAQKLRGALRRMAAEDPRLAARLVVTALPAAAAGTDFEIDYELDVADLGSYHVAVSGGHASVSEGNGQATDFTIETDAKTLAQMAAGASPLWLMLSGKLHVRGKRRKALKLRALSGTASMREVARLGGDIDPDLIFGAIPYVIDPEWTKGKRFTVAYDIAGANGGRWYVRVGDEGVSVSRDAEGEPEATVKTTYETWLELLRGELTPAEAMFQGLTEIEGQIYPVTLVGRWLDRAEGRDDTELEREAHQRQIQMSRLGLWGSVPIAGDDGTVPVDPAQDQAKRKGKARLRLLSYEQLYSLWERQNWSAHELDFSVDREQWLALPTQSQQEMKWSMGSFYVGEERVAADLAPFVVAAPSGEVEAFLATQLVDEARHAVFFDRFGGEVMALEANDLRGRLMEIQQVLLEPWRVVFDDNLRAVAHHLRDNPDDLDAFVEGIVTYHMVIEGVLAMTGQHIFLEYTKGHSLFPGFYEGFSKVQRDEHRHVAFGVRFLRDALEADPKYGDVIERKIAELVPKACHVLVPPGVKDPSHFKTYDYTSDYVYGFAYRALKRRMAAIGLSVPPPEELMPGPIDEPLAAAA